MDGLRPRSTVSERCERTVYALLSTEVARKGDFIDDPYHCCGSDHHYSVAGTAGTQEEILEW